MTDWSKLKVAELKEECKARDIPLTGLKLKQQYIDKLGEYDANKEYEALAEKQADVIDEKAQGGASGQGGEIANGEAYAQPDQPQKKEEHVEEEAPGSETLAQDAAVDDRKEQAGAEEIGSAEEVVAKASSSKENPELDDPQSEVLAPTSSGFTADPESKLQPMPQKEEYAPPQLDAAPAAMESAVQSNISTPGSTQVPPAEFVEDQRKRKRRSVTPAPDAEEMARKKAKANDGTRVVIDRDSDTLARVQQATDDAQALREADGLPNDGDEAEQTVKPMESFDPVASTLNKTLDTATSTHQTPEIPVDAEPPKVEDTPRDPSPSLERSVAPSLHPATSSLYIRNFKRPLHIPTLKDHIIQLARSRADSESDPIKTFYLDSIRTHALISFTSSSAAGRVRAEMHGSRFPDEPQRELLFVDYIPDDKVQEWIDQETGGGFGGGRSNKRFEIVYKTTSTGVEAVLQDPETSHHRPLVPPPRASISTAPKASVSSSGIHPDRMPFVPLADRKHSSTLPDRLSSKHDAAETGFKALDELFSFTTSKPKLYYKPVSPEVVDDRLDMVKGLRVGHTQMGRSGDEGMKRYTFEKDRGREEWVDKGPEFGFGNRGVAIMRGEGRGRGSGGPRGGGSGGYRGNRSEGGYRGGRGDSWRGR